MENEVGVTKDANKKSEVPNGARKDLKPLILRDISPRSGDFFLNPFRREAANFFNLFLNLFRREAAKFFKRRF